MSRQKIRLVFSGKSENPDGNAVARRFSAIMKLLVEMDRRSWEVGHARYAWEISLARKESPFTMEIEGRKRIEAADEFDVVSIITAGIDLLDSAEQPRVPDGFTADDLRHVARLAEGNGTDAVRMVIESTNLAGETRRVEPSKLLARKIKRLRQSMPGLQQEYVSIEGRLKLIAVSNDDPKTAKFHLDLVVRETGEEIYCTFLPADSEVLGAHIGHSVFVEGFLEKSPEGGRPRMSVNAFKLLPKQPLSLDEIHAHRLRVPNGMNSDEYVRSLRARVD